MAQIFYNSLLPRTLSGRYVQGCGKKGYRTG
uniref:Uncharacterized protein n=1 Tax=Rhizophora mucronata TaxID=61149 RepID=A0A2P2PZG3_RHIMU